MTDPWKSNLPFVRVQTDVEIPDEPKVSGIMRVTTRGAAPPVALTQELGIGIEVRGHSSQGVPKKQYSVELRDQSGNDLPAALLGLPLDSDWILQGPYIDKTLLRNALAYGLSNDIGRYASRVKFIDLRLERRWRWVSWDWLPDWLSDVRSWLRGTEVGTYSLLERIKRSPNRVDVQPVSDRDPSGGYIVRIDKGSDPYFTTTPKPPYSINGTKILYFYPKGADVTPIQGTWIRDFFEAFELSLASPSFTDPATGYATYIDVASFVDYLIINELFRNVDAFRISTYMHKDRGAKLVMGPVWDFDLSMGNAWPGGRDYRGWVIYDTVPATDSWQAPFWWKRLLEDPSFVAALDTRWQVLRSSLVTSEALELRVKRIVTEICDSQFRNFQIWPILGQFVWPNAPVRYTYPEEIGALVAWLRERTAWIDQHIAAPGPTA